MREFDRKFGKDFLASVPLEPGIYRFLDDSGVVLYVGKALRLRRRLQQYRNASRLKKHRKMRKIFGEAKRLEFEVLGSHREACLKELSVIQSLRPKFNVSGAFSFLYPMIGIQFDPKGRTLSLYLTNQPEKVALDFPTEWHGAYRSRSWTREFFWALVDLLEFSAHRNTAGDPSRRVRGVSLARFRQVDPVWVQGLGEFLSGTGARNFLELWILQLLENAGARSRGAWVQERIRAIHTFQKHECAGLLKARCQAGYAAYPVAQADRDRVFLESRLSREASELGGLAAQA